MIVYITRTLDSGYTGAKWRTVDGTAIAGTDYVAASGVLEFYPGEKTKSVEVNITDNEIWDPDRSFTIELFDTFSHQYDTLTTKSDTASSTEATIYTAGGAGDGDDTSSGQTHPDVQSVYWSTTSGGEQSLSSTVLESVTKDTNNTHTLYLTRSNTYGVVSAAYTTIDDSGVAGIDYDASVDTVVFDAGVASVPVTFTIFNDALLEVPDEIFKINITDVSTSWYLLTANGVSEMHQVTITDVPPQSAQFAVSSSAVQEGGNAPVVVSRSSGIGDVTVQYHTVPGTASTTDFTSVTGSFVISSPDISHTLYIQTTDDIIDENDESFTVKLDSVSSEDVTVLLGSLVDHEVTITDDDTNQVIEFESRNSSVAEEAGSTDVTITRSLLDGTEPGGTVTVDYYTTAGTASVADYTTVGDRATFTPGVTSKVVSIPISNEWLAEGTEQFTLNLTNVQSSDVPVALGIDQTHTINITDTDVQQAIGFEIGSSSVSEEAGSHNVTVVRNVSGSPVDVTYTMVDGSGEELDYESTSGILEFASEDTSKTISVTILDDLIAESSETFSVKITDVSYNSALATVNLGTSAHTVTILDTDSTQTVGFEFASSSANEGSTDHVHNIKLYRDSIVGTVSADYYTANGTGSSGVDYTATNGTITFNTSQSAALIPVTIKGDQFSESNETFTANLSNIRSDDVGVSLGSLSSHTVTITNDDVAQTIGFLDSISTISEEVIGSQHGVVVTRSSNVGAVTVEYIMVDGTAGSADYTRVDGTLSFDDGDPLQQNISIDILNDLITESSETFAITLNNIVSNDVTVTMGDSVHIVTITDGDSGQTVGFASALSAVTETDANFTYNIPVDRSTIGGTVSTDYYTTDGTAINGADYTAATGTIIFTANESTVNIPITILGDTTHESSETFTVSLCNARSNDVSVNSVPTTPVHTVTITDDDPAPTTTTTTTIPPTTTTAAPTGWTQLNGDIEGNAAGDAFGRSVSLNSTGDRVAIGAPEGQDPIVDAGYTSIYEWNSGTSAWDQLGSDIDGDVVDSWSGNSVSLNSTGDRVAIGVRLANHTKIYEYSGGTWTQLGPNIDGEATNDRFGKSVSLNSAGDRVAIGATGNDDGGANAGAVYVYEWNSGTSTWDQLGGDIDGDAASDYSGCSVSLNSAGDRVAIGAHSNDDGGTGAGQTRIYEWNSGTSTWDQLGIDIDGSATLDRSGESVSLNSAGDRVAIGAPYNSDSGSNAGQTRIYEWNSGTSTWDQLGSDIDGESADDLSGYSVCLNGDGDRVIIGGFALNGPTRIFEWDSSASAWTHVHSAIVGDIADDRSGQSVSINSAGNRVAIGADATGGGSPNPGYGRVYYDTENIVPAQPAASSAMVAWYKFEGDWTDSSGNGYDLTEVAGGTGGSGSAADASSSTTGSNGASLSSYANFNQFADVTNTGDIGTTNYRYLKSTDTNLLDVFKYTNAFTVSFWINTNEPTPTSGDDLYSMDIFSVGDYSYNLWGTINNGEGFKIQLTNSNQCNDRTGGGDADEDEWYLSINLGADTDAYSDSRKCRDGETTLNDGTGNWSDEGFASAVFAGEISDGNWHNIVVSYDPNRQQDSTYGNAGYGAGYTILVYIDGVRLNTKGGGGSTDSHLDTNGAFTGNWSKKERYHVGYTSTGTAAGNGVLTIGDKYPLSSGIEQNGGLESTSPYGGKIADLRIYNRILTDGIEDPSNLDVDETDTRATTVSGEVACLWNNGNGDIWAGLPAGHGC
jgi:hypothetical protein